MTATVLVIDNDPRVGEILRTTLASGGFVAAGVNSYPERLHIFRKGEWTSP